jgi:hypothetical protein
MEVDMKKLALIVTFCATFLIGLNAEISAGGFLGFNANDFYGESSVDDDLNPSLDLNLGVLGQAELIKGLVAQPELLYITKGVNQEADLTDEYGNNLDTVNFRSHLSYLQAGMLGKFSLEISGMELQPCAGLYLAYLLKAKTTADNDLFDPYEWTKSCNRTDLGLTLGGDVIMARNFFGGVRCDIGLSNLYKSDAAADHKNLSIRFHVGYLLRDIKL